jgi:4-hydroxy-tetrahydrodipicolinate synthase
MELNNYHLWTALVTPFTSNLNVDFDSLKALVNEQEQAGNGLLILGSTGEALNIGFEERKAIIEYVMSLNPSVPVMVGVGGHNITDQKGWLKYLETQNIQAYLMVTPLYAKPGDNGQYQWFKELMDEVTRPVMLYNVPGRTGKELSLSAVERLKNHKNFWAIKEASGSVEKFKEYLSASGNAPVYCGDDGLMPDFAMAGSSGLVSVASNVWPKETHTYVEQCLNKTFDAKELWTKAADSLFIASNPIPAKCFLAFDKRITTNLLMPPLSHEDLSDLSPITKASQTVKAWFAEQGN